MKRTDHGESKTKVLDLAHFKKFGKLESNVRTVEQAPEVFREFRPYDKLRHSPTEAKNEADDIINDLLSEYQDELSDENFHIEEKAIHFFGKKKAQTILGEDDSFKKIVLGLTSQLKGLKDNCGRIKFLVSEIENNLNNKPD
ncbi:MAG: hypothetical protein JNM93_05870 [Bacteriovoracaceae bacterium]|nr:hypothetical protein [Bacteriovoracaceae bacterium]